MANPLLSEETTPCRDERITGIGCDVTAVTRNVWQGVSPGSAHALICTPLVIELTCRVVDAYPLLSLVGVIKVRILTSHRGGKWKSRVALSQVQLGRQVRSGQEQ